MRYRSHFLEIFQIVLAVFYLILNTNIGPCARAKHRTFFLRLRGAGRWRVLGSSLDQSLTSNELHEDVQAIP